MYIWIYSSCSWLIPPRPDNCDGSYQSSCDSSRAYTNITDILQAQDRGSLLSYMNKYWLNQDGSNEEFWSHEWDKHGTCVNTIDPTCYGSNYEPQQEVGDFFQKTVDLFKSLNTYQALSDAGITPGGSYDLSDIEDALAKIHDGKKPYVSCESGALNQVYYYFVLRGNAIDGTYKAVDSSELPFHISMSSCLY